MSQLLSPDGLYYWDGKQWRSITAGGGAAPPPPVRSSRVLLIVAAIVIPTLLVGGLGVYLASNAIFHQAQRILSSGHPEYASPGVRPGATVSSEEDLCGGRLGAAYFGVDCTQVSGTPPGVNVYDRGTTDTQWQSVDITAGRDGCQLDVGAHHTRSFDTAKTLAADSVTIADFVTHTRVGGVGLQIACTKEATCVDFSQYGDGAYSLDEGIPEGGYENLTSGPAIFTAPLHIGQPNRLIVRVHGQAVTVFLNGTEVARGTTTRTPTAGYVVFYVDNRYSAAPQSVQLQRMLVFGSA